MLFGMLAVKAQALAKGASVSKVSRENSCTLYRAINGTPDENMAKIVDLLGGIEEIVGTDDIVVIKPNVQWWNQGVPNLLALKTFVDLIMNRPAGFIGEVVLAENCHRGSAPWKMNHSGWSRPYDRNIEE